MRTRCISELCNVKRMSQGLAMSNVVSEPRQQAIERYATNIACNTACLLRTSLKHRQQHFPAVSAEYPQNSDA